MNRILSLVMAAAFAASLGSAAVAGESKGNAMKSPMGMQHACPKGKAWVQGYKKKDGTKVKGYCR